MIFVQKDEDHDHRNLVIFDIDFETDVVVTHQIDLHFLDYNYDIYFGDFFDILEFMYISNVGGDK